MKIILILLLSLSSISCSDTSSLKLLNDKQPILAFGDSLTYGYGASRSQSYPAQLKQLLGKEVINAGKSGETSDKGVKRLADLLDKYQPQLLLLCHGGNDMLKKRDLNVMKDNLAQMIEMAQVRNFQVLLISVPRATLLLPDIQQYQVLASEYDIPLDNDTMRDVLKEPSLHSDTIRANAQGYRLIAQGTIVY